MRLGDFWPRIIAFILLALVAGGTANAREVPMQTCVYRLAGGEQPDAALRSPEKFSCGARQNSLGSGDFVTQLRFAPVLPDPSDPLVLRTASVWQDSVKARFQYADGSEAVTVVDSRSITRLISIGAIVEYRVPVRQAALKSIILETRGSVNVRGVVLGAKLMSETEAHGLKLWLAAIYGIFAGLSLALFIYNLSLWRALRHRFQLYYAAMVGALASYAFTSSGALSLLLPFIDNNARLRINYILLTACAITGMRFVRRFFEPDVCSEALSTTIRVMGVFAMVSSLAFAMFAPWKMSFLDKAYYLSMSGYLLLVFPLLYTAWRQKARHFGLFMLAWAAPILVSTLRAAYGFNLVPYSILLDNGNLIAMAIEAVFSSVMVTARLRDLTMERDDARAGERTARRLANTDPLTGLLNRRAFLDLAIGRRTQHRLLLIDIDHFKSVNDRLGHEAGDRVLEAVAQAIQEVRPERSLAVRLGGEEFALLIPRSIADKCKPEQILEAVRTASMPQGRKVTVSIGLSEGMMASEEDWKRLYRLADAALYRAKADGRDRVCKATDFRSAA